MSDNIPFELQVEIMKRLPIKSLVQFRSVSKAWKSLIQSSHFITTLPHSQLQHLLVSSYDSDQKYVSLVDDDSFPGKKVSSSIPQLVSMLQCSTIIGSSHGLLCLYGMYVPHGGLETTGMAVLWNPTIRKAVAVVVPGMVYDEYEDELGFGVCGETSDPKIVRITPVRLRAHLPEVQVFTLSTGAWRSSYGNLPRKSIEIYSPQVIVDGFLYWLATDSAEDTRLIISFDMISEEFGEVNIPHGVAHMLRDMMALSKLRESLVLVEPGYESNTLVYHVWIMGDDVPKSFKKLYTVNTPHALVKGFTKKGKPIIEIRKRHGQGRYYVSLAVYEPSTKRFNTLGISGCDLSYFVYFYTETLLLLDQPEFVIYDQGKRYISKEIAEGLEEHIAFTCKIQD